ncbi:MAG: glycosyltransferase family 2 protein [Deltaproteobacteria bacterium]|nr:glycosyltransferase family 2 protein [Deltaproteobacteria bacterium]
MLLSVVLSFRNEEEVIPELIRRLRDSICPLGLDYEFIFVNDYSLDRSLAILKEEQKKDPGVKIINMSRVFGNATCILAGLKYSSGDVVVYMDADLQDPPELIPKMLEEFNKGADVVYTTRLSRDGESWLKMLVTKWAYRILKYSSNFNLPVDSGDFKMLSRRIVNEVIRMKEKNPFVKGLVSWVGFKQVPVYYHREKRFAGETHFPFFKGSGIQAFFFALTAFSTLPLNLALLLGFIISFLSFFYLIAIIAMFFIGINIPGWTAIMAVMLILGGTQLLTLGLMGIYLGRVYEEVKARPNYIVESTVGFEGER